MSTVDKVIFSFLFIGMLVFGYSKYKEEIRTEAQLSARHQKYDRDIWHTDKIKIYSLSLIDTISGSFSSDVSGAFLLGCGGISGSSNGSVTQTPVYYFYVDDGKGGFILKHVDAETTSLVYVKKGEHPYLQEVHKFHLDAEQGPKDMGAQETLFVPRNYKLNGQFAKELINEKKYETY